MKRGLLIFCLLGICAGTALWGSAQNTARYCRQHINKLDGKNVSIDVLFFNPLDVTGSMPNAVVAIAYTWDERSKTFGGVIPVLFQRKEGERALSRYGVTLEYGAQAARSRMLRGVLTRILREGRTNLIYLDCSNSGEHADDIKPALAQVLETQPDDIEFSTPLVKQSITINTAPGPMPGPVPNPNPGQRPPQPQHRPAPNTAPAQ